MINTLKSNNKKWFKLTDRFIKEWEKNGELLISPTSIECWNYPTQDNDWGAKEDPNSTAFDVMGHNCVDIQAYRSVDFSDIFSRLKYIYKYYNEGFFDTFKELKDFLFDKEESNWVWVIDALSMSLIVESQEMAEDLIAQKLGFIDSTDMFSKKNMLAPRYEVDQLASRLIQDKEEVFNSLVRRSGLVQVSPYMWVNQTDPTCVIVDDNHFKFDMRDGWSSRYLCKLVAYWLLIFYQIEIQVSLKSDSK